MLSVGFLLWLVGAMVIFLFASTALRNYVDSGNFLTVAIALFLYCLGNLMMVRLMREGGLGVAISISAIMQLLMANAVAFFWFNERPHQLQIIGILLGVIAVGLIMWPTSEET